MLANIRFYPSARGPSTSGGALTIPRSRAALTASTSGPEFVLGPSQHTHVRLWGGSEAEKVADGSAGSLDYLIEKDAQDIPCFPLHLLHAR